jgi:hypothetical protein
MACYDKEIYYYTHAPSSDINFNLFQHTSLKDFVQQLQNQRQELETGFVAEAKPFVLVHGQSKYHHARLAGAGCLGLEICRSISFE